VFHKELIFQMKISALLNTWNTLKTFYIFMNNNIWYPRLLIACMCVCVCACSFLTKYYVMARLGRYAAYVGSCSLTFRDRPSVLSSRVKLFLLHCWTLGSGTGTMDRHIGKQLQKQAAQNPDDQWPHLHHGGSLKSRKIVPVRHNTDVTLFLTVTFWIFHSPKGFEGSQF
jgi:hypothetical protein